MNCKGIHDFEPLVMERRENGINTFVARYCRKCGMVTDDRKAALRLVRALDEADRKAHEDALLASIPPRPTAEEAQAFPHGRWATKIDAVATDGCKVTTETIHKVKGEK